MNPRKTVLRLLVALGLLLLVGLIAMAADDDDDAGDDDTATDDDSSPITIDDDEFVGCEGAGYEQCENVVAPELLSLELVVNGTVTEFPAILNETDQLEFVFEYVHPQCNMTEGYPFIIVDDEAVCLSESQFLHLHCSSETEGPATVEIDPSYFANGDGAPYGFEISDVCGHHSNRLPVDIVTASDDDDNDDSGCGC